MIFAVFLLAALLSISVGFALIYRDEARAERSLKKIWKQASADWDKRAIIEAQRAVSILEEARRWQRCFKGAIRQAKAWKAKAEVEAEIASRCLADETVEAAKLREVAAAARTMLACPHVGADGDGVCLGCLESGIARLRTALSFL